ncbi:penicillin-binding protein 1A [Collimonas sp. OK412]|jgi:penicillin-binding protein 1A|uniref:penicillin-binding protein 1A n=1 Tax=Collimonas sp. (strain OK412) TaxID=1801619 RepID=UPI0008E2DF1E|nr:PBP1A family penicillin-binding protein [Collimonas sp. OK412]SFC05295.1 penicillin-binding protein 1A [Collimonas sp. OK412]
MRQLAEQPKSGLVRRLKFMLGLVLGLTLAASLALGYWLRQAWQQLPAVDHLAQYSPALPLRIYSSEGVLLAEYGEERREFLPIAQIPLRMRQALLAIEDARFYQHGAVDFTGLLRATLANAVSGQHGQGASTITMQVARGFFLTREKTVQRKLMEILLAYKLEQQYSKDKLLELYMNQIYLGERSYGFAAASNIYFDKPLEQLSTAEAAMLAGLPKAPSAYNPVANPQRAQLRQQYILQRMLALGDITQEEFQQAMAEKLVLNASRNSSIREAAYVVEEARQMVVQAYQDRAYTMGLDVITTIQMAPQLAADKHLRKGLLDAQARRGYRGPEARLSAAENHGWQDNARALLAPYPDSGELRAAIVTAVAPKQITAVLRDGRPLQTSLLDPRIAGGWAKLPADGKRSIAAGAVIRVYQDGSQRWLLSQLPEMEGALVSLDAQTGDILALAGGFDFFRNPFDHALQAFRQPGSSFKPFVYSAALEKGYFPGTMVDDTQRLLLPQETGARAWRPRNYGNNYEGFITVRRGLMRSKNLVAVSLMQAAGADYVQGFATQFGFLPERNPASLPLALGAGAVTPLQLAQSYAVFANGGYHLAPRLIKEIRNRSGHVFYADTSRKDGNSVRQAGKRVISARNAYLMDSMLQDVVKSGTGHGAKVLARGDTAGKTGTSNNAYDAWFAGYSSGVVSVVWLGYDQPKTLGNTTGGALALPVWSRYMQVAVKDRQERIALEPAGLTLADGDYIYSEYLDRSCLADSNPFIHSKLKCEPGPAENLAAEAGTLSAAQERAQILKMFSSGD